MISRKKEGQISDIIKNNFFMLNHIWKVSKFYIFLCVFHNTLLPTIAEAFNILIFKFIYDAIAEGESFSLVIISIITISFLQISISTIGGYKDRIVQPKVRALLSERFNNELINKSIQLDICCYDDNSFYNRFTKALGETDNRALSTLDNMTNLFRNVLTVIAVSGIIVSLDILMLCFVLIAVIIRMLVFPKQNKIIYEYTQLRVPVDRKVDFLKNVFYSPRFAMDLRTVSSLVDIFKNMFAEGTRESLEMTKKVGKKTFKLSTVTVLVENVFIILLPYLYLCSLAFNSIITIGGLTALYSSMQTTSYALTDFFSNINSIINANMYIKDLRNVLNIIPTIDNNTNSLLCDKIKEISFENVCFAYHEKSEDVIHNLSFSLSIGEKLALVGPNGAGKTTIVKLLLRLYDVKTGEIKINGINIKEYDVNSLRKQIFALHQNFSVYPIQLIKNILLKDEITIEEEKKVYELMKKSGLLEHIENAPHGLSTYVTREFDENGLLFSGGELQKIALLRAFFKQNSSIMILDEPSSALDPLSENSFYENLVPILDNKISIIITHRLASLSFVDKVCFIKNGQIVGIGNLQNLLETNKDFREYYDSQAKYYVKKSNL